MKHPELSIIIPVYNVENYLRRCLDSILSQAFYNFEVIIVNDGSSDCSGEILDEYASKDKRFIVVHQKNAGVSAARNTALKRATGTYLTFVDPDDYIHESTYIENITFMKNNPKIDIVQFPYTEIMNENVPICIKSLYTPRIIEGQKNIFAAWWAGSPLQFVLWNKIYKRNLWTNLNFVLGHISEDTRMIVPLCQLAKNIYISDKGMYFYQRARKGSYTHKETFEKHIDLFDAHCQIFQLFKKYPELRNEKVIAFTRLYRRLIQAKLENPKSIILAQEKIVSDLYPSLPEIVCSNTDEKILLLVSKILGVKLFIRLFCFYLHHK